MQKIRLLCLLIIANMAFADGGYYVGIGAGYSNITANAVSPLEFTNPTLIMSTHALPAPI
jgi:hypothetical protein